MRAPATRAVFDPAASRRRSMIAKVHVAKTQLALVDDDYRAVMLRVVGRDSAAKCTDDELVKVVKELERLGFSAKTRSGAPRPADHPSARKARALWISLHQLGAVQNPSDHALEAFAARQLNVERLQWANQALAYRLIEALKAMGERAGWSQNLAGIPNNNTVRVLKVRLVDRLLAMLKEIDLIPADWSVRIAALRLGGMRLDGGTALATMGELDVLAKLFADKRREAGAVA